MLHTLGVGLALTGVAAALDHNLTSAGRRLLVHEVHRSGTLCLERRLAPTLLMLGCQRCGTSSLYEDVMLHVRGARRGHALHGEPEYYGREQHFFATDSWSRGMHHYLAHFPPCPDHKSGFAFATDATPAYLRKPIVVERLVDTYQGQIAKLKFVVLLRDPTDRLYAYWDTFVLKGTGVDNFDRWVKVTMAKVAECQQKHGGALWPPPDTGACDTDTIEGVAAGLYAPQLSYWVGAGSRSKFAPSQFLLTTLDAYERETAAVLRDVAAFIGAPNGLVGTPRAVGSVSNPTAVKVWGAMPTDARKSLGRFYKPWNGQLERLLDSQPRIHYSPSLRALKIGSWAA